MESHIDKKRSNLSDEANVVEKIKKLIEKHYLNLTEVQSFIDKEGIKEFIFRKLWNEIVSEPPLRYLTKLKMQYAARQLFETNKNISEISFEINIEDPLYFSRMFKKFYNQSPRAYRKDKHTLRSLLN
jgi:AraC-like DNA-binding protein